MGGFRQIRLKQYSLTLRYGKLLTPYIKVSILEEIIWKSYSSIFSTIPSWLRLLDRSYRIVYLSKK